MAIYPMTPARWIHPFALLTLVAIAAPVAVKAQAPAVKSGDAAPAAKPGAVASGMRRLTEQQYRNVIADLFGEDIQVAGRMDPIARRPHELQIAGVGRIAVSPTGA